MAIIKHTFDKQLHLSYEAHSGILDKKKKKRKKKNVPH